MEISLKSSSTTTKNNDNNMDDEKELNAFNWGEPEENSLAEFLKQLESNKLVNLPTHLGLHPDLSNI